MIKTDELYKQYEDAKEYVNKIGAYQHHLKSSGKLTRAAVSTEINYQAGSGDTNYWKDAKFDTALSKVIRDNFTFLSEQALVYMKAMADDALLAEKKELQERLAKIEALEQQKGV